MKQALLTAIALIEKELALEENEIKPDYIADLICAEQTLKTLLGLL